MIDRMEYRGTGFVRCSEAPLGCCFVGNADEEKYLFRKTW